MAITVANMQKVEKAQTAGITVKQLSAFVLSTLYKLHFGIGPGEEGCTAAEYVLPLIQRNGGKKGTIMELAEVPAGLSHEVVEVWSAVSRAHKHKHPPSTQDISRRAAS